MNICNVCEWSSKTKTNQTGPACDGPVLRAWAPMKTQGNNYIIENGLYWMFVNCNHILLSFFFFFRQGNHILLLV